ncbi:LanC-like protein 2,Glutathione S-transferase LANCL1 [Lepeophtheirus salmonis]|uniref:LanC-like protein 2,Glutathione S-transferase LANCL1 n=1 Tax=Lepeophtheirus salmonis TaxID=72036 RepID=A0A7R8H2B4_LEPSM|nr:LanC-like protein 2,Glutathione S-transferase LANCL1 [Lepeophtheirus salmonis]CAF2810861.1 LanC-like protein 2,Glutathione S-transferase LANCL1 [Lepeophtheirus salmonis]
MSSSNSRRRDEKRYFNNPFPNWNESAEASSFLESNTISESNGYLRLKLDSALAIKIREAQDQLTSIIDNAKDWVFLGGIVGPLAFASAYGNQKEKYLKVLLKLKDSTLFHEAPEEFLYGKAGYLFALLLVKKENPHFVQIDEVIKLIISVLFKKGLSKSTSSLQYEWHEKEYLGGAHGYAGILSTLLRAKAFMSSSHLSTIRSKIDDLRKLQFESGNFPSSTSSSNGDKLVHWCHGAPSFSDLYLLAFETFKDEKYLKVAEKCLNVIWERGLLKKGFGLCHGSSGNGYSFLLAYKNTQDPKYMYMALRFAEWCMDFRNPKCSTPDRPYSLFEDTYFPCYTI